MPAKTFQRPSDIGREMVLQTSSKLSEFYSRTENSDKYFGLVRDYITKSQDLDLSSYREPYLHRRLYYRISRLDLSSYKEYLDYLKTHPAEPKAFKDILTIHVTSFFRDVTPFKYLEKILIPKIDREKQHAVEKKIRIFSAPCSTGEEPYSLAIIAEFLRQEGIITCPIEIYACDIESSVIEFAREGFYPSSALKNISNASIARNFKHFDNDIYQVKPCIKSYIKFFTQDLIKPLPISLGRFDIISCRNFLIYISRENQKAIVENMLSVLRPSGYLMLGKTEGFPLLDMKIFGQINATEHFYQYAPDRTNNVKLLAQGFTPIRQSS